MKLSSDSRSRSGLRKYNYLEVEDSHPTLDLGSNECAIQERVFIEDHLALTWSFVHSSPLILFTNMSENIER